jgi:hypothetical protein
VIQCACGKAQADLDPCHLGYRQDAQEVANIRRMAFKAAAHENILFPVPYAENEQHKLIITTQRIVQTTDAGSVEVPTMEVGFVGRNVVRPRMPLAIGLIVLAIPLVIYGAYSFISVWGYEAAAPGDLFSSSSEETDTAAAPAPDPNAPEGMSPEDWKKSVLISRIVGAICLLSALGLGIVARKQWKVKRYFIMCKTVKRLMRIEAKDEVQQTQIMVTISAIKGKNLK